ncbi:MAG: hypothetical protein HQM11_03660 [SAR324 cluster bacterium]|nr:hypothetical protein [SAR324 cluster bacterium]
MKLSTCFIIDSFDNQPISLFWKQHQSLFEEHCVPLTFVCTTPQLSIADLTSQMISDGWKKIIYLGNSLTMFHALNALMKCPDELRQNLSPGFWPLSHFEIFGSLIRPQSLNHAMQVFKAGHTFTFDLARADYEYRSRETIYFWKDALITIPEGERRFSVCLDHQPLPDRTYCHKVYLHPTSLNSMSMTLNEIHNDSRLRLQPAKNGLKNWKPWLESLYKKRPKTVGNSEEVMAESLINPLEFSILDFHTKAQKVSVSIVRHALPVIIPLATERSSEAVNGTLRSLNAGKIVPTPTSSSSLREE